MGSVEKIALRLDDVGASTKKYNVYSKIIFGNTLFLKYIEPFKAWAPYREMKPIEWEAIFNLLDRYDAKLTVGVTASWVGDDDKLIYFPNRFPDEAAVLKDGVVGGRLEIANHGLTHCVVGRHKPKLFSSNRNCHREFWDWVPNSVHFEHIQIAQEILEEWLGSPVTTFIPPGNIYTLVTLEAAKRYGIERVNSRLDLGTAGSINVIGEEEVLAFHDREIVLKGVRWLEERLASIPIETKYAFVKEL